MKIIYVKLTFSSLDGSTRNSLNKAISYLAENWGAIDPKVNPHSLALVTYALHLAQHPQKDQVWDLFSIHFYQSFPNLKLRSDAQRKTRWKK